LEGLEISEIHLSGLERTKRIDAEFFRKEFLRNEKALLKISSVPISELVAVSDGNHFSISDDFTEDGIPYYRGQDITGQFFAEQSSPIGITRDAFEIPSMRRSHLKKGDVLLSIVGTVGSLALVGSNREATCSCKLAIFRPKSIESEFLAIYLASKPGADQIQRFRRGTVQTGFLLEDTDQVVIPQLSRKFTKAIVGKVAAARAALEAAREAQEEAEGKLLESLGLISWKPPTPLTYESRAGEVSQAGRLDAEFFQPRIKELYRLLGNKTQYIRDVADLRQDRFCGTKNQFNYLEIGAVSSDGTITDSIIEGDEAPSRATWYVERGDVLTSTVRPIRGLTAIIEDSQHGSVASSGFAVLTPKGISSELLLCYLKLSEICELMDLHTSASMYPAISVPDILDLPFKYPGKETEEKIVSLIQEARGKRAHSKSLLERAKRAVEIAIEVSEETALAYLDGKHYLAEELLPKLFGPHRHYVDLATVQRTIEAEALIYEDATINRYLHEWTRQGRIHDAGRGWYSDLHHPYQPNWETPPLPELEKLLGTRFPLLEYTVWSTRQFTSFFHQYAARHATFLMVERDAMAAVADALMEAGHHVVIHPLGDAAKHFALTRDETIILRPRLSSDHKETHASVEQMLVDFHHEIQKLGLFELGEFQRVFENLANFHRLNIPALKRYAERRKVDSTQLLKLGGIT
jgi:hypothetical protein